MILRIIISAFFLILLTLVQTTWLGPVAILGATPDLGLLAVLWLSYRSGPLTGTSTAFISGLVDDALSSAPLGFNAFTKTLVAWASSFLHGSIELDHVFMPFILGAAGTLLKALSSLLLAILFQAEMGTYDFLGSLLWVEVAYNAVLAPLLFAGFGQLYRLIEGKRPQSQ